MALQWKIVSDVFISHGASLEDEFDFHIHGDTPASQAINIVRGLNTFLADVTLIWRCWVMYGGSLLVVAIPSLCLVTETVSVIIVTVLDTFPHSNATGINWRLVYYLMTLITNGLCTFLILFRIVRISGVGASFKTYRGIIEILVESAAIYSAIYIALLVTYAYASYTNQLVLSASSYLMMISYSITGITPTLIIARVMAGHSRPDDSWTRPSLPHLRTPMRSIAESLRFASAPNRSTGTSVDNDVEQADGTSWSASHNADGKSSEAKVEIRSRR